MSDIRDIAKRLRDALQETSALADELMADFGNESTDEYVSAQPLIAEADAALAKEPEAVNKPNNPWLRPGAVIAVTNADTRRACDFEQANEAVSWQSARIAELEAQLQEAQTLCAEAYQVVGSLASDLGEFENDAVVKVLDNLSKPQMIHDDALPFPSFADKLLEAQKDAARYRWLRETSPWPANVTEAVLYSDACHLTIDQAIDIAMEASNE